ncbi:unnamed protein product [Heligmosomoides polygyrus]|uniref:Ovule protein n=1 Tax=Heligmosomoides polygyrus TaxID=6339 RepID=A0A183GBK1_HELPZ|nr:unnamed protein product [Heligmosomoides polygyrus]
MYFWDIRHLWMGFETDNDLLMIINSNDDGNVDPWLTYGGLVKTMFMFFSSARASLTQEFVMVVSTSSKC